MRIRNHHRSKAFTEALADYLAKQAPTQALNLEGAGTRSLAAWFIGPKAENQGLFESLITRAVQRHCQDRRDYFPSDPIWITEEIKQSAEYKESVEYLENHFSRLIESLKGSVPFFSYRYQGHMNWDITMPGLLGYFAAMLYNQNNVAAEASPITTPLEMAVGDDLCEMLGYRVPKGESKADEITAWGHITCDGSVANLEAMWASRNLKYYPISLAQALQHDPTLAAAKNMTMALPSGQRAVLIQLDHWQLLNLRPDDVLAVPTRMQNEYGISNDTLSTAMDSYSIQNLGFTEFNKRFLPNLTQDPAILAPATMHYSWPKAAAVLGIGSNNIEDVHVDLDARMEISHLRTKLDECLANKRPVIMVVAVTGSTEESAVDPLSEVIALREEYSKAGLEFPVHADAAWGGYFASILREDPYATAADLVPGRQFTPEMTMSKYVEAQYRALQDCNSITIDPHKAGYIPYPAGGLCYRNSAMRNLVSFTAPVVYHGGIDPTVGVYGIEGSKPGAAAAGVYLSHRVIRTNRSGYGKILGKTLFNSKRLYSAVVTMAADDDPFIVVPFQRLPAEKEGKSPAEVKAQLEYIRREIVPKTNDELIADPQAMALFRELGSDQTIIAYAFNFKTEQTLNKSVDLVNDLNNTLFELLSLSPDSDKVYQQPLIVTSSDFEPATYGPKLLESFKQRLGVEGDPTASIAFLLSTTMDPWLTDTSQGNFIPTLIAALREAVLKAIAKTTPSAVARAAKSGA